MTGLLSMSLHCHCIVVHRPFLVLCGVNVVEDGFYCCCTAAAPVILLSEAVDTRHRV